MFCLAVWFPAVNGWATEKLTGFPSRKRLGYKKITGFQP